MSMLNRLKTPLMMSEEKECKHHEPFENAKELILQKKKKVKKVMFSKLCFLYLNLYLN